MRPEKHGHPGYVAAFGELMQRVARSLEGSPRRLLPVRAYVAGGAALHFYTGARVSRDIGASWSRPVALPDNLQVAYRDVDGAARVLYVDTQYNDTLALMHEDTHADSVSLQLRQVDPAVLDVRLLSPLDLAVSKLSRFSSQDREDIESLARAGLLDADKLLTRATEALEAYVGDTSRVKGSIAIATRIAAALSPGAGPARPRG